jgi:hypothetical protein
MNLRWDRDDRAERGNFILDENRQPKAVSLMEWAVWVASADRHVGQTTLADGTYVSTVFLGINSNFMTTTPKLFETMVFLSADPGTPEDGLTRRYATWVEAEEGHRATVEKLSPEFNSPTLMAAAAKDVKP